MIVHWIHTSDVHGHLDALQSIENHVNGLRGKYGTQCVMLTDGGDSLQGTPQVYYHNYIDTHSPHVVAETIDRMRYDCVAVGNHDIEAGHEVYDRVKGAMQPPFLCANIRHAADGTPYFHPYTIIEKAGMRIAVLSLITPDTIKWISPSQYEGMEFVGVEESARQWIAYIKEHEHYDMLVGIFHIGWQDVRPLIETIQDFDLVLYGHDHHSHIEKVGRTTCAAPSAWGMSYVSLIINEPTRDVSVAIINNDVERSIAGNHHHVKWLDEVIGHVDTDLNEFDSYFGPSSFLTLIHRLQLSATGAQVSLAAPVSYDAFIPRGTLRHIDVFTLYSRYSQLYTMRFTLEELKGILEYSYSLWANTMRTPADHALLLDYVLDRGTTLGLKHFTIDFLTAYGIDYTVDLTRAPSISPIRGGLLDTGTGRVNISCLHTPSPGERSEGGSGGFLLVCLNSYHANGGGDILTRGTGLSREQLRARVVKVEPCDLRMCLANEIIKAGDIHLDAPGNWRFVPESWAKEALERDRRLLEQ